MHCPNCGNPIEDDDLFCGECGHKISRHPQSVRNAESEITKAEKNDEEQNITSNNKENNATTHQNVDSTSHDETRSNENDVADSTLQSKQSHNDTQQSNLSTYNQRPQHREIPQNQHNHAQQQSQISQQAKQVTNESKGFFKSAFTAPDEIIQTNQVFSFKLLLSLLIIGFIVLAILLASVIPVEIGIFGTTRGSLVTSIIFGIILFLVVIVGAIFGLTRLVVRQPIAFKKVLSDYVLINSVSLAILIISVILILAESYSFGGSIALLSLLLFIASGIYLIAKYSTGNQTRISSYYGVIIYIIIFFLFIRIFGEAFFHQIFGYFIEELGDLFEGGTY
ncbi:zinc-ribbon domain-containing protein [Staphylococcus epidermidis]|uniref:zinc-ribbon domain-containing protein n=1 Tax=Staphylococcus epidermidis TaxID=1282 RepID=UPI0019338FDF|nr:zinc-ribbon domain-containing protein [Staphylococcus epidermidis]MBM0810349.1 zinc-ribbon domain-containing protein [Staphylococcus epidermidis]MBM0821798.1 zinc-ribbon domain-containing protein [Staphylococcus epidermidis]MBM0823775.1 zinc-ribbon domain-containing protein [Staphylococcus epidermidis]MBM0853090.1 zinc-ribbon domain-containing protein [Staphylococcus epidermidis]